MDDQELLATLAPAERVAYVLHELMAVPLDETAAILGRSGTATRQLAGRARRRIAAPEVTLDAERVVQGRVVEAFLTALRNGDLDELAWLLHPQATLHPDTTLRPDAVAVLAGTTAEVTGADAVAAAFADVAPGARAAVLDGFPAAARTVSGTPAAVFGFTVVDGRIAEIELITDPETVARLDLDPTAP